MKKSKRKKLEDWEREFYKENKTLIDLDVKYSEEELEEQKRLNDLLKWERGVIEWLHKKRMEVFISKQRLIQPKQKQV